MFDWLKLRKQPDSDALLEGKPATFSIHKYVQGSSNLFEENRLLKFSVAGLFACAAVLSTLLYTGAQNQRTVVVPWGASGDLYVTGAKPSAAYLRAMTWNIVGLAGSYNAYSADTQFEELLKIVHPSDYGAVRSELAGLLDELKDNPTLSIATYIRPETPVTYTASEIVVPVEKVRVIGGVVRKFRGDLHLGYAVEQGRFWLTSIREEKFDVNQPPA